MPQQENDYATGCGSAGTEGMHDVEPLMFSTSRKPRGRFYYLDLILFRVQLVVQTSGRRQAYLSHCKAPADADILLNYHFG